LLKWLAFLSSYFSIFFLRVGLAPYPGDKEGEIGLSLGPRLAYPSFFGIIKLYNPIFKEVLFSEARLCELVISLTY
jgi:hypothetical protein